MKQSAFKPLMFVSLMSLFSIIIGINTGFSFSVTVDSIQGKVGFLDEKHQTKPLEKTSLLTPESILLITQGASVTLHLNNQVITLQGAKGVITIKSNAGVEVTIPEKKPISIQRLLDLPKLKQYAQVLECNHRNLSLATQSNASISIMAGTRGYQINAEIPSNDVMLESEDEDGLALSRIKQGIKQIETNLQDVAFETLSPLENYHGTYQSTSAFLLGNLLFERSDYLRALPLLKIRLDHSQKVGHADQPELSFKMITCLFFSDELEKANEQIDGWLKAYGTKNPLTPNVLYYKGILSLYLNDAPGYTAAFKQMKSAYPEHTLTKMLEEDFSHFNAAALSK